MTWMHTFQSKISVEINKFQENVTFRFGGAAY